MSKKDFVAPRADKTLARYRAYLDMTPVLVVDCERAHGALDLLASYNPSYKWSTKLFGGIAAVLLLGGFVSWIWLPWWTTPVAIFIGYVMSKSTKQSCADFVQEIVSQNPAERQRFASLGIVREEAPPEHAM